MAYAAAHQSATYQDMADALGYTWQKVRYAMDDLKKQGKIRREGGRKKGRWVLVEAGEEKDV